MEVELKYISKVAQSKVRCPEPCEISVTVEVDIEETEDRTGRPCLTYGEFRATSYVIGGVDFVDWACTDPDAMTELEEQLEQASTSFLDAEERDRSESRGATD